MMRSERFRIVLVATAACLSVVQGCSDAPRRDVDAAGANPTLDAAEVDGSRSDGPGHHTRAEGGDTDATPDVATPDVATPDVATPDVATPDVATPDVATPDADAMAIDGDADADCPRQAIWPVGGLGFIASMWSDRPNFSDAGCPYQGWTYEFSIPAKTLSQQSCSMWGEHADYLVNLTDGQVDSIVTRIASIYETCRKQCGSAHGTSSIVVRGANGSRRFSGNFSSSFPECGGGPSGSPAPLPPFVNWNDIGALGTFLSGFTAICTEQDSGQRDGGTCVVRGDGGTEAGPSDDAADDATSDGPRD